MLDFLLLHLVDWNIKISQRYYVKFFAPNVTFYSRVKETNLVRKERSYGNIFVLLFKVIECPTSIFFFSLRHQRVLYQDSYVILLRERICKNPMRWYLHFIPSKELQIRLQKAEKMRQRKRLEQWAGASFLCRMKI